MVMQALRNVFKVQPEAIEEGWKITRRMPPDRLRDIAKLKPKQVNGSMAFMCMFIREGEEARDWAQAEDVLESLYVSIANLYKEDCVLMGESTLFNEMRRVSVAILADPVSGKRKYIDK